jgi:organic radical activating enzyme
MKFPWDKYEEVPINVRNTIQVFVTNQCNLKCPGCFARKEMKDSQHIALEEFETAISTAMDKGAEQVNLLGGEPLIHPNFEALVDCARYYGMKVTTYTNGSLLHTVPYNVFRKTKFRVSIYGLFGNKGISGFNFPESLKVRGRFDSNFMVGKNTTLDELIKVANISEKDYNCETFFISSIRELDNPRQEFFDDTDLTMPVLQYKELVHNFLNEYEGNMKIHISKRGVFESTKSLPHNQCKFVNYFIGGNIIQCPYDVVNKKYQKDYEFDTRNCQQNNTCLMSKIIVKRK